MAASPQRLISTDLGYTVKLILDPSSGPIGILQDANRRSATNEGAAAAAAKSLQSCPTLCDHIDGSPPGSPSLGFSRHEHWRGLPFPSPMHESESEVTQSCPTLSDPMDCGLPGSSIHGIFQARVLEWGAIAFSANEGNSD